MSTTSLIFLQSPQYQWSLFQTPSLITNSLRYYINFLVHSSDLKLNGLKVSVTPQGLPSRVPKPQSDSPGSAPQISSNLFSKHLPPPQLARCSWYFQAYSFLCEIPSLFQSVSIWSCCSEKWHSCHLLDEACLDCFIWQVLFFFLPPMVLSSHPLNDIYCTFLFLICFIGLYEKGSRKNILFIGYTWVFK